MEPDEELLRPGSGRPPLPRWARVVAVGVAVVVAAALITVRLWPDDHRASRAAVTTSPAPAPSAAPSPTASWPTVPAACGNDIHQPIVSAGPAAGVRVATRVLIGGSRIVAVDFDSGQVAPVPGVVLATDEYVTELSDAPRSYALTYDCRGQHAHRLLRVQADGHATAVGTGPLDDIVTGSGPAWSYAYPADGTAPFVLRSLDNDRRLVLPRNVAPVAVVGGSILGYVFTPGSGPSSVVLVGPATGRIRQNLGEGEFVASAGDRVVWTHSCQIYGEPTRSTPCTVRVRSLATSHTQTFPLPRGRGPQQLVPSPDRRFVALTLSRNVPDPRYAQDHPGGPSDLALLDLRSGQVSIVPGIELPAKTQAGLAFSSDGSWLLAAINAGTAIRLLAWRPGLAEPIESPARLDLPALYSPPMVALTAGS